MAEVTSDPVPSLKVTVGVAVLLLVSFGSLLAVRAALDDQTATVRVVGDSFPELAQDQLRALFEAESSEGSTSLDADISALGGTSICSWWDRIDEYVADEPDILVVAFAGNDMHPCITDDPETSRPSDVVAEDYRADLETVIEKFEPLGTDIYLVLPPPVGREMFEERAAAMRDMYHATQEDHPDLTVIDSASHLDPDGEGFQLMLPCEEWDDQDDCHDGEIQVRDEDDIHFTPAGGERYARAIFEGIGFEP